VIPNPSADHPPRTRRRHLGVLAAVAALVVFAMGSCTGALGHDTPTPAATRTVEKRVTVVPDDCLTALTAADDGFTAAGQGFYAASDGFGAVRDGDLKALDDALADAKTAQADLNDTVPAYTTARDACRAAASGGPDA